MRTRAPQREVDPFWNVGAGASTASVVGAVEGLPTLPFKAEAALLFFPASFDSWTAIIMFPISFLGSTCLPVLGFLFNLRWSPVGVAIGVPLGTAKTSQVWWPMTTAIRVHRGC